MLVWNSKSGHNSLFWDTRGKKWQKLQNLPSPTPHPTPTRGGGWDLPTTTPHPTPTRGGGWDLPSPTPHPTPTRGGGWDEVECVISRKVNMKYVPQYSYLEIEIAHVNTWLLLSWLTLSPTYHSNPFLCRCLKNSPDTIIKHVVDSMNTWEFLYLHPQHPAEFIKITCRVIDSICQKPSSAGLCYTCYDVFLLLCDTLLL